MRRVRNVNLVCRKCGKLRYATRESAERAMALLAIRGRDEKRVYEAHGWWHVTSQPSRGVKGRARSQ